MGISTRAKWVWLDRDQPQKEGKSGPMFLVAPWEPGAH